MFLNDVIDFMKDLDIPSADEIIDAAKEEITPDVKPPTAEEIQSFIDRFKGRFGF